MNKHTTASKEPQHGRCSAKDRLIRGFPGLFLSSFIDPALRWRNYVINQPIKSKCNKFHISIFWIKQYLIIPDQLPWKLIKNVHLFCSYQGLCKYYVIAMTHHNKIVFIFFRFEKDDFFLKMRNLVYLKKWEIWCMDVLSCIKVYKMSHHTTPINQKHTTNHENT